MKIKTKCEFCLKEVDDYKVDKRRFCSLACYWKSRRGETPPGFVGKSPWNKGLKTGIVPKTAFKKGNPSCWKGKKRPDMCGEKHFNWKGDFAGYMAKHDWIKAKFGTPSECDICGTEESKRFEWANISGEYKREISDWKRLCSKCRHALDNITNRGWITRKEITCACE